MPSGNDQPVIKLPQEDFAALRTMSYDATALAFRDAGGNAIYLFARRNSLTSYEVYWFHGTDAQGAPNPKGLIAALTATVIKDGTYNGTTGTITFGALPYVISLLRDPVTGAQFAQAVPAT